MFQASSANPENHTKMKRHTGTDEQERSFRSIVMHRFPVEILTHIFQLAVEISYASGQVKDTWAALHVVCRRWYQIMLTEGVIASDIRITDEHWDVGFAPHLLERSIPYSIRLTMVLENRARNAYTIQQLEAFAEHVLTIHRTRIQSMVVGRSGFHADLKNLLLLAVFHRLRHLTIGSHLPRLRSLNVDELSRVIPAVNTLSLASTTGLQQTAGQTHPIFLNLVTLELTGSPSKHDDTKIPWEFLQIIGRIPALKSLVLSDYFPESSRPSWIQPVVLSASVDEIKARRTVELDRTDPLTVVDIVTGALRNVEKRAINVENDQPATGSDFQGADKRQSGDDRRARLEILIAVTREQDVAHLRLASGVSSMYNIRVKNVGDHLAFAIACIPVDEICKMSVYSDEPVRVLWQFLKQSKTLVELQVIGRSVAEFAKLFEEDSEAFLSLRDVSLADSDGFSSDSHSNAGSTWVALLRALARRRAEGVCQVDALAIPETASRDYLISLERYVGSVTYITKAEILGQGSRIFAKPVITLYERTMSTPPERSELTVETWQDQLRTNAASDAGPQLTAHGRRSMRPRSACSARSLRSAKTPKDRLRSTCPVQITPTQTHASSDMAELPDLSTESFQRLATMLRDDPTLRAAVESLMANRVETALSPYFNNPPQFRTALGNARAVLSGSWVLHLIVTYSSTNIPSWTEGDLDVYCHEDGLAVVVACLLGEGYLPANLASDPWDLPSKSSKKGIISRVLKFRHEERGRKIDVVCTNAATPIEVVLDFWTTLLMNVVTVHDLTILYPDLTLAKQGRQPVSRLKTRGVGHLISKYIARGFQIWPFSRQRPCGYRPDQVRNTRDKYCLTLPIATPDGFARGLTGSSITEWTMGGCMGDEDTIAYTATRQRPVGGPARAPF
ncbi:hypothetical protein K488DRAFT_72710 [Vararia minispora EC-137]|uniref:Uncharacterized protein n=1 Tax=Vararia minispora EC-137 TaxID=1314806 RepID=A0ACB8QDN2_9AGAM|nr:hypothetical protein K488DRAFT_72710 [Vararia minispora EC-137]